MMAEADEDGDGFLDAQEFENLLINEVKRYKSRSKSVFCSERGIFELCDAAQASLFLSACDTECEKVKNGSAADREGDGSLVYDDKADEAAEAEETK